MTAMFTTLDTDYHYDSDFVPTVDTDGEPFTDVPTFACRLCGGTDGELDSDSNCADCIKYAVPPITELHAA